MVNLDCKKEAKNFEGCTEIYRVRSYQKFKKFLSCYFKRITDSHIAFFMPYITQTHLPWLQKRISGCWVSPKGFKAQPNFVGTGLTLCVYFSLPMRIFIFLDLCPNRELLGLGPTPTRFLEAHPRNIKKNETSRFLEASLFLYPCILCCFVLSCPVRKLLALERSRNYMFQPLYLTLPRFVGWNWLTLTVFFFFFLRRTMVKILPHLL